jgi:hypothetical protein
VVLILLLVIQLIARPLNVLLSTAGSSLSWRERALLAWIAPRHRGGGGVGDFRDSPGSSRPRGALLLVPLTFAVIIGTVVLQSATARPLAPAEGCRTGAERLPDRRRQRPGASLGKSLQQLGSRVLLTDSSWENIRAARMEVCRPTSVTRPRSMPMRIWTWWGSGICWRCRLGRTEYFGGNAFRHDFGHQRLFGLASGQETRH